MITQVDTNKQTLNSQGEVTRSKWYALRILRCSAGMTIAWKSPRDQITALAGALYTSKPGIDGLWVSGSGTIILEYTDDPAEMALPPVSVAGANLDGAGNTQVVGVAPGSGAPVLTRVPNTWNVEHKPAAATLATISSPAPAAGQFNVLTDLEIEIVTGAAASGILTVTLVDDLAVPTWTKTFRIQAPANGIDRVVISGVHWKAGNPNSQFALSFSGAGPAASLEKVTMAGYTVAA